jgi:hypothetical protein
MPRQLKDGSAGGAWQRGRTALTQRALLDAARQAVTRARKDAVTDPGELFEAGARAYLQGSRGRRDLTQLFSSGDVRPGSS